MVNVELCAIIVLLAQGIFAGAREAVKQQVYITWTMTEAVANVKKAEVAHVRMETIHSDLIKHLMDVKDVFTANRKKATSEAAKSHNVEVKLLKPFTTSLSPTTFPLAKWLREHGLISVDDAIFEEKANFPVATNGEDDVAYEGPLFIPANQLGVGSLLRRLPSAMGMDRVNHLVNEMDKSLNNEKNKGLVMIRLPPRGQPHDSLEQLEWLPLPWRNAKTIPERLADFGTPWFVGTRFGCIRKGLTHWPMQGVGQFVVGVHGQFVLCTWPGESVLSKGCEWIDADRFLFNLANLQFRQWAKFNLQAVLVDVGCVAWIPYGWGACMVGVSMTSAAMIQPVIAAALAMRCGQFRHVAEAQTKLVEQNMANPKTPFGKIGPAFVGWMKGLLTSGLVAPVHVPAIADAPHDEEEVHSTAAKEGEAAKEDDSVAATGGGSQSEVEVVQEPPAAVAEESEAE